ncbi:MAG: OmpA family protein [Nitrospiraceae bacterium]
MKYRIMLVLAVAGLTATGCVSRSTHTQTLAELDQARRTSAQTVAALDDLKKQSAADIEAREGVKAKLSNKLLAAQSDLDKTRQNLDAVQKKFDSEREGRQAAQAEVSKLTGDHQEAQRQNGELKRERDLLQARADDLQQRLEGLEKEKNQLIASHSEARDKARDLETKLASEAAQLAALREDKQRLLSGTTTAQEEIARLQKRAGELETHAARVADLTKRLEERDQEIGTLRQAASDRETLASKLAAVSDELEKLKQTQETLQASLQQEQERLKDEAAQKGKLDQERQQLLASLQQEQDRLKAQEAEKNRLEQERLAKEEEIRRLTQTHEDLTKSLQAEIAKGDITIQQVRDRLTINMVDRVLFDSGQAQVKPAGLKVLKQVSDVLKKINDKQIRIEGHTDNVPIGAKLREKFATNWELSTARATSVVRYLIDEGGVDRSIISAAGYADTRPMAGNDVEEGRTANRRIEIVLYPKDLSDIMKQVKADAR